MSPRSLTIAKNDYGSSEAIVSLPDTLPSRRKSETTLQLFIRGGGMFCESYFLFSVGNLEGIFKHTYPHCWSDSSSEDSDCPSSLRSSITYTEIVGVVLGMLVVGSLGDRLGRRWGSRLVSGIMLGGAVMLCVSDGATVKQQFLMFTIALGIFGLGVGGEYPMASSSAAETSEPTTRGRNVVMVFSMQGLGILVNSAVITLLLVAFKQTGDDASLDKTKLEIIWRSQYALGVILLGCLVWYRFYRLEETPAWKQEMDAKKGIENMAFINADSRRRSSSGAVSGHKNHSWVHEMRILFHHFWHRVLGSGGSWFVWDVTFYGNKLFQGRFINIIEQEHTVFTTLKWTLVNASIAYLGYFVAAYTMDKQWMGRRKMQAMGFAMVGAIFLLCGCAYNTLKTPDYIHIFQLLYYVSSFFGQWGPNATTFLLPSEVFPTELRGTAHGISAASGKLGALLAGLVFSYIEAESLFIVSGICGAIGLVLTLVFVPDTTKLPLQELDSWWESLQDGAMEEYVGQARHKQYLSWFEKVRYGHVEEEATAIVKAGEYEEA
eukprot:gb/GECG01009619.1/.p1 GENE.gb/GECG01009619.1/~~gb/GECG01009619.1/.p1  ORF type:complete len:548 (+),score=42.29 gb/GECG01009619.1/:1-1644(+)